MAQLGRYLLAAQILSLGSLETVMYSEALFGGLLTTIVFAIMMRASDHAVGATHYTALSGRPAARALFGQAGAFFAAQPLTGAALSQPLSCSARCYPALRRESSRTPWDTRCSSAWVPRYVVRNGRGFPEARPWAHATLCSRQLSLLPLLFTEAAGEHLMAAGKVD